MGNENNRELTMAAAISEGMAQEMERDENVFVMGEDVAKYGGIFCDIIYNKYYRSSNSSVY